MPTLPPLPGPAHALAWMRVRGLLTEDEQKALEKLDAVTSATPPIRVPTTRPTTPSMPTTSSSWPLRASRTRRSQRYCTATASSTPRRATWHSRKRPSPAQCPRRWRPRWPGWPPMARSSKERFDALRAQVAAEPAFAMASERARIVADAQASIEADDAAIDAWKASERRTRRIGAWKFMRGRAGDRRRHRVVLSSRRPACPPAMPPPRARRLTGSCSASRWTCACAASTRETRPVSTPSVSSLREVGYRKADRVRGCTAVMTTQGDDDKQPDGLHHRTRVAEERRDDRAGRRRWTSCEARFGHLDAQRQAALQRGTDSLTTSAPMTSAPPVSTLAPGTSSAPNQASRMPKITSSSASKRDFGRLEHAGADHRQHAGNRQLHQAQQGQQADVMRREAKTARTAAR
jgi:hypothetical protein